MSISELAAIKRSQLTFFHSAQTRPWSFRLAQLQKLKQLLVSEQDALNIALQQDLNKSPTESLMTEMAVLLEEINLAIRHGKKWLNKTCYHTPWWMQPAQSYTLPEPYGAVMIFSAWNFPLLLAIAPLIGAIVAGNCAMLNLAAQASQTSHCLQELINAHFHSEYIYATTLPLEPLLNLKHDYIFFTGGIAAGQQVMSAAAKYLTPLTLELGGKSPVIVDVSANLDYAARKIVYAKFINAGQTCIAPDFVCVQEKVKNSLIILLKKYIHQFFSDQPQFGKIINHHHFERLTQLLDQERIVYGAAIDRTALKITPTLIEIDDWYSKLMAHELFGPILPILSFESMEELLGQLNQQAKPLACYLFSNDRLHINMFKENISFGGGAINDCLMHFLNINLPFGGVGSSGMGAYHGKHSFDTFSHQKSIYQKYLALDIGFPYPPYQLKTYSRLKKILSWWQYYSK